MDHNLVHFIASDAHNTGSRPPTLSEVRDLVIRRWGRSAPKPFSWTIPWPRPREGPSSPAIRYLSPRNGGAGYPV